MALFGHPRAWLLAAAGVAAIVLGIVATILIVEHTFGAAGGATDAAGLPTGPIIVDFIDSRPDGHLEYPGATVLDTVVNPEGPTICSIHGCSADQARVDVFAAATASAATAREWYKAQLGCSG